MRHQALSLTAQIVSAHVAHNAVAGDALPALVHTVCSTLTKLAAMVPEPGKLQPAVPVEQSVTSDWVICLEDGKKCKTLRPHVRTAHGMTLEQYQEKWNLPPDHPMVAPNYARKRSALAKALGTGRYSRSPGGPGR